MLSQRVYLGEGMFSREMEEEEEGEGYRRGEIEKKKVEEGRRRLVG